MQRHGKPKEKVYVFELVDDADGELFNVTTGQTLIVNWNCPNGNRNGWVLNGNGCCPNITNLYLLPEGFIGERTVSVTQSGTVRVGSYSNYATFAVQNGTITVTVINP